MILIKIITLICLSAAILILFIIILYLKITKDNLKNKILVLKEDIKYNSTSINVNYFFVLGEIVYSIHNRSIVAFVVDKVIKEKNGVFIHGVDINDKNHRWNSKINNTFNTIEEARISLDIIIDNDTKKLLKK